jgi:hypothetical protein
MSFSAPTFLLVLAVLVLAVLICWILWLFEVDFICCCRKFRIDGSSQDPHGVELSNL